QLPRSFRIALVRRIALSVHLFLLQRKLGRVDERHLRAACELHSFNGSEALDLSRGLRRYHDLGRFEVAVRIGLGATAATYESETDGQRQRRAARPADAGNTRASHQ